MPYTPPSAYGPLGGQTNYGSGLQLVDEVLSTVAKQFAPDGFLYDQICAPMPVSFKSGRYPVFDPSTFFAMQNVEVADDAETPTVDFNWSHDIYLAKNKRLKTRITRDEANSANPALRLEYSKLRGLLSQFATARENRLATRLRAQSNGGQITNAAINPSVHWDLGTSGSPAAIQADIQAAALTSYKACGKRPNTLILDYEVALAVANDFTLKDLIKYTIGPRIVAEGIDAVLPPTLFGFKVLIADGTLYDTARPGQAVSLTGVWGNSARLVFTDPNAGWGQPATAYSFRAPVVGGIAQPPATILPTGSGGQEPGPAGDWAIVDRWWEMDPPAENVRVWECVDERLVAPELGIEIQNVLSSY